MVKKNKVKREFQLYNKTYKLYYYQ